MTATLVKLTGPYRKTFVTLYWDWPSVKACWRY